ncbi:MAG: SET domain-containing protein [Longimicrobiales bacterium]
MPQKRRTGSTQGTKKRSATSKRGASKRTSASKDVRKRGTVKKASASKKAAKRGAAKRTGTAKKAAKRTASTKTAAKRTRKDPYEVRRSTIQGKGAFATRDIRRGERIGEYRGERISWEEADSRYDDEAQERHHTFLFEVDDETVIDAGVRGSGVKYINHSCDPNCEALIEDGRVFIEAIRPIRKGQELFYDYAYVLDERHTPAVKKRYPCWCGSKNCRGTILAKKR